MSILVYIIFGGIVGWVASLIMGTDGQQGIIMNVVVGIVGSVVGSFLASLMGLGGVGAFNLSSFLVALVGSVVLLGTIKLFQK